MLVLFIYYNMYEHSKSKIPVCIWEVFERG